MTVWPFKPTNKFSESLEWLTSIHSAKTREQRSALRTMPRQFYSLSHWLNPAQYSRAKRIAASLFNNGGDGSIQLPLWAEMATVASITSGAMAITVDTSSGQYLAGGEAIVWVSDTNYELVAIDSLNSTTLTLSAGVVGDYVNCTVAPVATAWVNKKMAVPRKPGRYQEATIGFVVPAVSDIGSATLYPSYLSHDVVIDPSVAAGSLNEGDSQIFETFDNSTGVIGQRLLKSYGGQISVMVWDVAGTGKSDFYKWLYSRRGKLKQFWLPSWNNDIDLSLDISSPDTTVTVNGNGFINMPVPFYIMIDSVAKTFHQVVDVTVGGSGTEVFLLSAVAGVDVSVASVTRISMLSMMRFNSDKIEINHYVKRVRVSIPVIECPVI